MNQWEQDYRYAAIDAGFWLVVAMLIILFGALALLMAVFGPPPVVDVPGAGYAYSQLE